MSTRLYGPVYHLSSVFVLGASPPHDELAFPQKVGENIKFVKHKVKRNLKRQGYPVFLVD